MNGYRLHASEAYKGIDALHESVQVATSAPHIFDWEDSATDRLHKFANTVHRACHLQEVRSTIRLPNAVCVFSASRSCQRHERYIVWIRELPAGIATRV